jgi:DNA repair protein RecO (recombination protein O)
MIEWQDEGFVLAVRGHGERAAILSALTLQHGRHLGLVHGGRSRRLQPWLQPGNRLGLTWRARLTEQLGHFTIEPMQLFASRLVESPMPLLALASACALVEEGLAEREPHPRLYAGLLHLLEVMVQNANIAWPETYIRFELLLLSDLGFGLDLSACAVSRATEGLAFVSPRSGRAVARAAAGGFEARLLPLPAFLGGEVAGAAGIAAGLRLTGYFLRKHVLAPADKPLPATRERLAERLQGAANDEDGE